MNHRVFLSFALLATIAGCKAKEVDPAYLRALEQVASAECACNQDPARVDDCDNPYPRHPLPPAGEPQAFLQYEASLSEQSRQKIALERAKLERCVTIRAQASAFKGVVDKRQDRILHPENE
jgi:hypothetical protein